MAAAKKKGNSPMVTRNGKTRLHGLSVAALNKLLDNESKAKVKAKIRTAIIRRTATQQVAVVK